MPNVVRVEYPDLSTDTQISESTTTGDSLEVVSRDDQRSLIEVESGDTGVSLTGSSLNDTITGGSGNDTIDGGAGDDYLIGLAGNDIIDGGDGSDTIVGGAGADEIDGGAGDDVLDVSSGSSGDTLTLGEGADTIRYILPEGESVREAPVVTDFEEGVDSISIISEGETVGNAAYDIGTGTVLLDGQPIVELGEDVSLNASDLDLDGTNLPISSIDSSETNVYQFLNETNDIYFYTVDENERNFIVENLSTYTLINGEAATDEETATDGEAATDGETVTDGETAIEGISLSSVDPLTGTGAQEVYRFLNTSTGTHLYTTSENERDYIIENLDNYNDEGVKFFGYEDGSDAVPEDAVPIYRFYNSAQDVHVFTPSQDEIIANEPTFDDEGIAFYVMPGDFV